MSSEPKERTKGLTLRQAFDNNTTSPNCPRERLPSIGIGTFFRPGNDTRTTRPLHKLTTTLPPAFAKVALPPNCRPPRSTADGADVRTILNRLAPKSKGNPRGLGIIDAVPWMQPVKQRRKRTRRVPLDDLTKVYINSSTPNARHERACWRRLLIVLAYATGLRRGDLLSIRWDNIDWQAKSLAIDPSKTEKADWFPLTDWAMVHAERPRRPTETVFEVPSMKRGGRYSNL